MSIHLLAQNYLASDSSDFNEIVNFTKQNQIEKSDLDEVIQQICIADFDFDTFELIKYLVSIGGQIPTNIIMDFLQREKIDENIVEYLIVNNHYDSSKIQDILELMLKNNLDSVLETLVESMLNKSILPNLDLEMTIVQITIIRETLWSRINSLDRLSRTTEMDQWIQNLEDYLVKLKQKVPAKPYGQLPTHYHHFAIVGNPGSGKSSFVIRNTTGEFGSISKKTHFIVNLESNYAHHVIYITEINNPENLKSYRGRFNAIIIMCDTARDFDIWYSQARELISDKFIKMFITKFDLPKNNSAKIIKSMTQKYPQIGKYSISAKSCYNFDKPFLYVLKDLYADDLVLP